MHTKIFGAIKRLKRSKSLKSKILFRIKKKKVHNLSKKTQYQLQMDQSSKKKRKK